MSIIAEKYPHIYNKKIRVVLLKLSDMHILSERKIAQKKYIEYDVKNFL